MLFQSYNICADYSILHNKIKYLRTIWQKNSFPLFFIDNCIKFFLDKLFITCKSSNNISDRKEIFICLEFLGKISQQSKKQLIDIFRTCHKKVKLNVLFWSSNKICNWLYVLIMSCTCFRVNLHSIFAWMSRNSLLETGAISEV